jgi:pimeloyl-ACP methyl ester carboxylesterase
VGKQIQAFNRDKSSGGPVEQGLRGLAALPLAAAAGWILYSTLVIDHHVVLPAALPAERMNFHSRTAGRVSFYRSGAAQGRPLVLLHSINAAASAYEMRPLFLRYADQRPVFAPDLPGFGFSEREKWVYSPGFYRDTILGFLEHAVEEPADVVALSLTGEFAALAALAAPERFASLTLISPTGFRLHGDKSMVQQAGRSGISNLVHAFFSFPVWARPFYDLLTTKTAIEYFLKKSFIGPVPQEMVEYGFAAAHQPGAEHAPLYFISGKLFTPGIRQSVYERLQVPTLVVYDRDSYTSFDALPETLAENLYWQAVRLVPSMGLPHIEQPENTFQVLDQFWK